MFEDPISKSLEWSRKGYMGMALLLMINERPLTGYEIMRTMYETTQGFWRPTPGGVYPVLKKLESEGSFAGSGMLTRVASGRSTPSLMRAGGSLNMCCSSRAR